MGNIDDDNQPRSRDEESVPEVNSIKTWKGLIWDTFDLPKNQRRLLFKLDAFMLTFASVSIDQCLSL